MRLQVKGNYTNQKVSYVKGTVVDVTPEEAEFLFKDSPGNFKPVDKKPMDIEEPEVKEEPMDIEEPETKEVPLPPADKMIHGATTKAGKK
jgi:hypothetical protein